MFFPESTLRNPIYLRILFFFILLHAIGFSYAQENSPYSRYGLGDLVPDRHISSRGMGGVAASYGDNQMISLNNPASLSCLTNTIFDLGTEWDIHVLKSTFSTDKYKANNLVVSYVNIGLPLSGKKMLRKGNALGLSFGLRPISRISYKIEQYGRIPGVDSARTLYRGTGGLNQAFLGAGWKWGRLRAGLVVGYNFGNKNYSTRLSLINDSVYYYKSNSENLTTFSGLNATAGFIYEAPLGNGSLRAGAYGTYFGDMNASRSTVNETFTYDGDAGTFGQDTITYEGGVEGKIRMPRFFGAGLSWSGAHWMIGADFEKATWSDYSYYDRPDYVQDVWKFRFGMQYYPAAENTPTSRYFQFVKYRAGFYYGPDYIRLDKNRNEFAVTAGASFPLTAFQLLRRGEFVYLNTGIEMGSRGDKESTSFRENIFRFCFGVSMTARWFQKPKYD